MKEVKRYDVPLYSYDLVSQIREIPNGDFVPYKDYEYLRAQLAEAQGEIGRMNISLELQADRVDKLIDENVKAEAENAALREQLKKMEEAKEYKDHEFCEDVECGAFDNGRCHARQCCYRTAKHFHRWLKQNGYKIIKSECKKGE